MYQFPQLLCPDLGAVIETLCGMEFIVYEHDRSMYFSVAFLSCTLPNCLCLGVPATTMAMRSVAAAGCRQIEVALDSYSYPRELCAAQYTQYGTA